MARGKQTTDTAPAPVMECAIAYSFDAEGGSAVTVQRGARLRADHPHVLAAPAMWFDPATTPDDERPREDFGLGGQTTVAPPRVPDGWRRDWHGGGKPYFEGD